MKNRFFLVIVLSVLAMPSCNKVKNKITTVVRDCTGTYIRYDGIDYHVCNLEKVTPFDNGATVKASFKKLKSCNGSGSTATVCAMTHENGGWIEVQKIAAN